MQRFYDVGGVAVFNRFVRCRFRLHEVVHFAKASTVDTASKATFGAVYGSVFALDARTAEHTIVRRNMVCGAKRFEGGKVRFYAPIAVQI